MPICASGGCSVNFLFFARANDFCRNVYLRIVCINQGVS